MDRKEIQKLLKKCFGPEKNERYHAIAMLIIFGLFIAVLVILLRTGNYDESNLDTTKTSNTSNTPAPTITPSPTDSTTTNPSYDVNYSYLYTFDLNGVKQVITGRKLDDKEIFTIITESGSSEYAYLSGNYLKKENGVYQIIENPSDHLLYVDLDVIEEITSSSTPNINLNQMTYYIPTSTLLETYFKDSNLIDSVSSHNTIILTINEGQLSRIDLDYSSLYSLISGTTSKYTISIELSNIGSTEDFDITIN